MNKIKNIAVFTSIRSEYGLLFPLLKEITNNSDLNLKLLVGGAHLKKEFGETIHQIIKDGLKIEKTFDFLDTDINDTYSTNSTSKLLKDIGEYFFNNNIDIIIILGDRYELIPVALAATLNNIPIAHISGGESTEGAIDNQIRHALSKFSHIHFPATEKYKENLLKMGEEEWRVCVSGEPGLDEILNLDFIEKEILFQDLRLNEDLKTIICTFHPQTIDNKVSGKVIEDVLVEIIENTNYQILVTASNFDKGGHDINNKLEILNNNYEQIKYVQSLGQKRYYSILKYANLMLGNSSSGIVEAQSFNLPVINVGNRQKGRLTNENVINCEIDKFEILSAIHKIENDNFFINSFRDKPNIYGNGNASKIIIEFLLQLDKNKLLNKIDKFG